jgi:hypothetical protein
VFLLATAFQAIRLALDVLTVKPPGLPPGHDHWLEARVHLTIAAREIDVAIEQALLAQPNDSKS